MDKLLVPAQLQFHKHIQDARRQILLSHSCPNALAYGETCFPDGVW